jgi:hypothetical protein
MGKGGKGRSFTGVLGLGAGLAFVNGTSTRTCGGLMVFQRLPTIPIMTPEVENI